MGIYFVGLFPSSFYCIMGAQAVIAVKAEAKKMRVGPYSKIVFLGNSMVVKHAVIS